MKTLATRITTLTDARYFAAREVGFLAFRIEEGMDGFIDPMLVKAIKEWVEGPAILGEFERFSAEAVRETVAFLGLNGAVVGAAFSTKSLFELGGLRVFREISEKNPARLAAQMAVEKALVEAFLIDADHFSTGFLSEMAAQFPVFLKTSASPEDILSLVEAIKPAGLIFTGSEEEKTGLRSFDEIEAVFEALEG